MIWSGDVWVDMHVTKYWGFADVLTRYRKSIYKLVALLREVQSDPEDLDRLLQLQREIVSRIRRTDQRIAELKILKRRLPAEQRPIPYDVTCLPEQDFLRVRVNRWARRHAEESHGIDRDNIVRLCALTPSANSCRTQRRSCMLAHLSPLSR